MSALPRAIGAMTVAGILLAIILYLLSIVRDHPEDYPWTKLDLKRPIGWTTGRKLAALTADPALCRVLLADADIRFQAMDPVIGGDRCGYADGVVLIGGPVSLRPDRVTIACPVAAALSLWETRVVQPAARRRFGTDVAVSRIDHYGSYSCRRIYGRQTGGWSEHATADAIDISGFGLSDGRRISVKRDWPAGGAEAAFLRDVRDGACDLFSTVLSPDYNAAHHDHLHLDQAERGAGGWRSCR